MGFLKTGVSQKYADQKLVGNWDFNLNATLTSFQESKPAATSQEMRRARQELSLTYGKTVILATLDNQLYLKNLGKITVTAGAGAGGGARGGRGGPAGMAPPAMNVTTAIQPTMQGQWSGDGTDFQFKLPQGMNYDATIDGDTLTLAGGPLPLTFDREY